MTARTTDVEPRSSSGPDGALASPSAFGTLVWLLVTTFIDGMPGDSTSKLFTEPPSTQPEEAGARPAILATLYIAVLLLLMAVPIGVATAIYLEEYARKERWYNRLLELNIQNLAAVPCDRLRHPRARVHRARADRHRRVLLAGALILTLVVLPIVIIASREAIRAVPDSIRQGGLRARRDQVAGDLAAGASRRRSRASRPARSSRCRARSARRRR